MSDAPANNSAPQSSCGQYVVWPSRVHSATSGEILNDCWKVTPTSSERFSLGSSFYYSETNLRLLLDDKIMLMSLITMEKWFFLVKFANFENQYKIKFRSSFFFYFGEPTAFFLVLSKGITMASEVNKLVLTLLPELFRCCTIQN